LEESNSKKNLNKNPKKEQRNGAKDVLFVESKMFFFQEQIMICFRKSNFLDTFSALNLNPQKKEHFSERV
jgi:hypothetical protein